MVIETHELDRVFAALADPTRRGILAQLANGTRNVKTLAEPYDMSQPAISKHLRVLEQAGLITRTRQGRENLVSVRTETVRKARDWIAHYARFWEAQFDALDAYLTRQDKDRTERKGVPDA